MSTSASYPPVSVTSNGKPVVLTRETAALLRRSVRNIGKTDGEVAVPTIGPIDFLDDDVPWTIEQVCGYFGGLKPIDPATIYKWIDKKEFPKPFKPGPQTSRWLKSEVVAYRRTMVARRDKTPPVPTGKRKKKAL